MYQIGEFVVCGNKGVCRIDDISMLDMAGTGTEKEYYILKPLYMAASTIYILVTSAQESLRKVLTKEEAQELIQTIPDIPLITVANDKMLEQEYRGCMRTNQCEEWIKIIKTINSRKIIRLEAGRKLTAIDNRYSKLAEESLYGELAVALDIPKESVEEFIAEVLDKPDTINA